MMTYLSKDTPEILMSAIKSAQRTKICMEPLRSDIERLIDSADLRSLLAKLVAARLLNTAWLAIPCQTMTAGQKSILRSALLGKVLAYG